MWKDYALLVNKNASFVTSNIQKVMQVQLERNVRSATNIGAFALRSALKIRKKNMFVENAMNPRSHELLIL